MPNLSNTLPHLPPAARLIIPAAIVLLVLAAALAAGSAYGQTGATSAEVNLAAARSADRTSATLTWTPPNQPSYQWIFIAAKVSPDAPNTNQSIDISTYRYAGQLLPNTTSTLLVPDLDPDTEYVYGHTSLRISDGQFVWTPWDILWPPIKPAPTPPPTTQLPAPTMTQLADGVYHYFGFFTSSLVVIGDNGVLITDPSNNGRAQSLQAEIAKITDAPVTQIVLSHEHYDHAGGTGVFPNAEVICHRNCQPHFALDTLGDVPDQVDRTFDQRLDLTVGGKTVQLHYLGPGDGDATTIVYMPAERIVATADLYEPRALTHKNWVHDKHFAGVRSILNTISQWDITHAVNAHSTGTNPVDLMENVAYYNDLYNAVKTPVDQAIMQAGGQAFGAYGLYDTLPQTLELPQYQDWTNYDTSFPSHVERMLLAIYHGD